MPAIPNLYKTIFERVTLKPLRTTSNRSPEPMRRPRTTSKPVRITSIPPPEHIRRPRTQKTGRITKKWNGQTRSDRTRGLFNAGNFCYRNAVLQCLLHLPEFYDYIIDIHKECQHAGAKQVKSVGTCVTCALQALVDSYWNDESLPKPPRGPRQAVQALNRVLKSTVVEVDPMYDDIRNGRQSDAYDFLTHLVGKLEEVEDPADRFSMADLTTVEHVTQWTCDDCGKVHRRPQVPGEDGHGIGLSVSIGEPKPGLSMLKYLREKVYRDMRDRACDSTACKKIAKKECDRSFLRERIMAISKAPEILIIRLARFGGVEDKESGRFEEWKLTNDVAFEEYLNLGEFTESKDPLFYQLMGVVAHGGDQLTKGHYIAAVRKQCGKDFCSVNDDQDIGTEVNGTVEELEAPVSLSADFDP